MASGIDYGITLLLTEIFGLWYVLSSVIGFISGGVTNFLINKKLVFNYKEGGIKPVVRYIIVWLGNLSLNTLGVFVLTEYFKLDYKISKLVSSVLVGITYSFIAQKKIVFQYEEKE